MSFIPEEEEAGPRDRKSAKYLRYDELAEIPGKMAAFRKKLKSGTKRYALLVRNELIIRFLLIMCWRQRNIRECRLGPLDKHNIFKQEIDPLQVMKLPEWAAEELADNPHAEFWQVYFREHETKIGRAVRGVLDRNLVKLLEEYIEHHRPLLLDGADSANLFVNCGGNEIGKGQFSVLVGSITRAYAGRMVTPHIFRDSFAHRYLEENPEDCLSLSKILWHRVLQTTIMRYGRYFDESHGMYKASLWLERRGTGRKPQPEGGSQKGSSLLKVTKRAA
jgi:integrase